VEHVIGPGAGFAAGGQIANVAFDELKPSPLLFGNEVLDFGQVIFYSGGEVVESDNGLVQLEEGFQQIGADETRATGHKPGFRRGAEGGS